MTCLIGKLAGKPSGMYTWFKAIHLIGMVAWFAGLFYMFRLFVYLVENKDKNETATLLKIMSHRLYFYITWPAFVFTWCFGMLTLMTAPHVMSSGWFHVKLLLLVLLSGYHLFIGYTLKRLKSDDYFLTSRQCRLWNEVPTLFLVFIVILAVLKPF
jgi:putative membrane protein